MQVVRILLMLFTIGALLGCGNSAPPEGLTRSGTTTIEVSASQITLTTPDGAVEMQRQPLGFRFLDAEGRPMLSSISSETPTPLVVRPPLPTRGPGGGQIVPAGPALFAPITFVVGTLTNQQFPASFWVGNMLASSSTGVEYRLTDVLNASVEGESVLMQVATSDPTGRVAYVRVQPAEHGSLQVSVRLDPVDQSVPLICASFDGKPGEAFRGFGGRRNKLDQRGEAFLNWAEEFSQSPEAYENISGDIFGEQFQFPSGPQGAYYVQSLMLSSEGYGFLLDRDELSFWRMASDREDAWRVEVAGPELDYLVTPSGSVQKAVGQMSAINGRHRLPPRWALGPMLPETIQEFADTPVTFSAKVMESLDQIESLNLPITAFAFEGWVGTKEVGTFADIIARLRARGIKPMTYFRGFVGEQDDPLEEHSAYEEAIAGGFVARNAAGQPYLFGSPLQGRGLAALVDFTNPATVTWWKGRIKAGLAEGSEGFMQDFGEQTLIDMTFHDGSTGLEMHNRNAILYHKATREAFDEFLAENPDREPWFFTRFGYSGRKGSAHYESASWGGDNTSDWSRASGIGAMIPDMLNRGVGGAYGFVSEISGYIDFAGRVSPELLIRWANLSSLMPVHRLHGGPVNGTPMPWRFGDPAIVEQYRATMLRHIAAQPLIMRLWRQAFETGIPINRPLWLQFPGDAMAAQQDQQYMLGPDVLVAPIVIPGATSRTVYFPAGCWRHPETGETVSGPREQTIAAAVDELPYFFRCGTTPFAVPAGGFGG